MNFHELAETYQRIEAAGGEPRRRAILVELFRSLDVKTLPAVAHLTLGEVIDPTQVENLGIGPGTVRDVIASRSGRSPEEIEDELREGDIAELAGSVAGGDGELTVEGLWKRIARGVKRNEPRAALVDEVLEQTSPIGATFFVRMVLNRMRIGVGFNSMARALAEAFDIDAAELERVYALTNDVGLTALGARKGEKALEKMGITLFHPYQFMNAQRVERAEEIFEHYPNKRVYFEVKYDGARLQIHISKNESGTVDVRLYSRRLNEVTESLPDVVEAVRKAWKGKDGIIEAEAVAYDSTLTEKQPFQMVLTRLGRKSDIEQKARELPFILYVFDILHDNGVDLTDKTATERRMLLVKRIKPNKRITFTMMMETNLLDATMEFFDRAVQEGHEGLMAKDPDGVYIPGKRTDLWLKLKPAYETLDVIIVGGIWGTGRRRGYLSSLLVAVRDEASNELKTVGKVGSGFDDERLGELTARLRELVVVERGRTVEVEPQIVIEVDFQDIQKTSAYESGYVLRIPRFRRERADKSVKEADSIERLAGIFRKLHPPRS